MRNDPESRRLSLDRSIGLVLEGSVLLVGLASIGSRAAIESVKDEYERDEVIRGVHRLKAGVVVGVVEKAEPAPNPFLAARGVAPGCRSRQISLMLRHAGSRAHHGPSKLERARSISAVSPDTLVPG
jgi:hypothetical protein